MKLQLTAEQRAKLAYEVRSFLTTFITFLAVEAGTPILAIYDGDLSKATLMAFLAAVLRAAIKASISLVFPSLKSSK